MTVYGRVLVKCQDFAFTGGRPWPTHVSRIKRFEQLAGSFPLAPVPELAVLAKSDSPDDQDQTSFSDDSNSTEDDSATTVYSSVSSDAAASMSDSSSW